MRKVLTYVVLFLFSIVIARGLIEWYQGGGHWPLGAALFAASVSIELWKGLK